MITGQDYEPEKTDLWSAGVTLYYMLVGSLPFNDKNIKQLYKKIINGQVDFPKFLSLEAIDLLKGLLRTSPSARFCFREVFLHPWMQKFRPQGYPIQCTQEKVRSSETVQRRAARKGVREPESRPEEHLAVAAAQQEELPDCAVAACDQLLHRVPQAVQRPQRRAQKTHLPAADTARERSAKGRRGAAARQSLARR